MIRKTFLCVAGILVGVSTGAYFDGFFEQENVVTNTYQQLVSNFNSLGEATPDGVDSAMDAENLNAENSAMTDQGDKAASADTTLASDSTKPKLADQPPKEADSLSDSEKTDGAVASTESKDEKEKAEGQEKAEDLDKAKSMALLNVRFSKEVFESHSGGELNYRKLSPRTAANGQPLPLIVFLHGMGERGDDNVSQLKHGLNYLASREGMQKFPATIIAPQCPGDTVWSAVLGEDLKTGSLAPKPTEAMRLTMELIDSIMITDNIDPDRVYVTGLSMGGFGTFDIIARRPSTFAAAVPLCGGGDTNLDVVNRIKKTPMWIIHGESDKVVPVKHSRSMTKALQDAGGSPRYSELAGFGHNIWDAAYADTELYKWMFNQSRAGVISGSNSDQKSVAATSAASGASQSGSVNAKQPKTDTAQGSQAPKESLKEAIQSDWEVLAATRRGMRADGATLEKMMVKFEEDSMTIAIGDRKEAAKYKLPVAENSPYPWIDMISERTGVKDSAGILAMQGDKLVICWGLPGESRPTTFDSKEGVKTLVLQKK